MRPRFEYGAAVRVVRNLRNDGTYPGEPTGTLLVRRGSVGYVRDVGTFLQDQLIYSVDFFDQQRMVGCREQELQPADDPWIPTRFEFRDKVTPTVNLAIRGRGGRRTRRPRRDREGLARSRERPSLSSADRWKNLDGAGAGPRISRSNRAVTVMVLD